MSSVPKLYSNKDLTQLSYTPFNESESSSSSSSSSIKGISLEEIYKTYIQEVPGPEEGDKKGDSENVQAEEMRRNFYAAFSGTSARLVDGALLYGNRSLKECYKMIFASLEKPLQGKLSELDKKEETEKSTYKYTITSFHTAFGGEIALKLLPDKHLSVRFEGSRDIHYEIVMDEGGDAQYFFHITEKNPFVSPSAKVYTIHLKNGLPVLITTENKGDGYILRDKDPNPTNLIGTRYVKERALDGWTIYHRLSEHIYLSREIYYDHSYIPFERIDALEGTFFGLLEHFVHKLDILKNEMNPKKNIVAHLFQKLITVTSFSPKTVQELTSHAQRYAAQSQISTDFPALGDGETKTQSESDSYRVTQERIWNRYEGRDSLFKIDFSTQEGTTSITALKTYKNRSGGAKGGAEIIFEMQSNGSVWVRCKRAMYENLTGHVVSDNLYHVGPHKGGKFEFIPALVKKEFQPGPRMTPLSSQKDPGEAFKSAQAREDTRHSCRSLVSLFQILEDPCSLIVPKQGDKDARIRTLSGAFVPTEKLTNLVQNTIGRGRIVPDLAWAYMLQTTSPSTTSSTTTSTTSSTMSTSSNHQPALLNEQPDPVVGEGSEDSCLIL